MLTYWWRLIVWRVRWWRWFFHAPYRYGDPLLGEGDVRDKNRRIINARHDAREPKRPAKQKECTN